MPIKTVADLPQNVSLRVVEDGNDFEFRLADLDGSMACPNDEMLGALEVKRIGEGLWMAENIAAVHGWGPWLVDVAMEYVTEQKCALFPHSFSIVPDAKMMWKV